MPGDAIEGRGCLVVKLCSGAGDCRRFDRALPADIPQLLKIMTYGPSKRRESTLLHSLTTHKAESPTSSNIRLGLRNVVFSAVSQLTSLLLISLACYTLDLISWLKYS